MSEIAADGSDTSAIGSAKNVENSYLLKVILAIVGAAVAMFVLSAIISTLVLFWLQHAQASSGRTAFIAISAIVMIPSAILGFYFRKGPHVVRVVLSTACIAIGIVILSFGGFVMIVFSPVIAILIIVSIVLVLSVILGLYLARRLDTIWKKITYTVSFLVSLLFATSLIISGFFYFFMILADKVGN